METNNKFDFLTSPRFWQLFLVGVAAGLQAYQASGNWITGLSAAIGLWFGGSVIVGTTDKFSQAKMAAATNTTVSIPSDVETVSASTTGKGKVGFNKKK